MTKKKKKKRKSTRMIRRFPRMEGVTPKVRLAERLLWNAYNRLAVKRNPWLGRHSFNVYETKAGIRAPFNFLRLGRELVKLKIDPSFYMKVVCGYGRWADAKYLPHPTWISSPKALEVFEWRHKSERKKYERETDWKHALTGRHPDHIRIQIRSGRDMVAMAADTFRMDEATAVVMLREELSPWYLAVYLVTHRAVADSLTKLLRSDDKLHPRVLLCLHHYRKNRGVYKRAKKIIL